MNETILVIGANGKFSGLVMPELMRREARVRAFIRHPGDEAVVRANGAEDVAIGDLNDVGSLEAALRGVKSVFYIAPAFLPREVEVGKSVVSAAVGAGVRRFVFSSVIHPTLDLPNHANKGPVENAVLHSGMEYTFLHPTVFFQNYQAAWSNTTRFSRVDYRDVAEAAAVALTGDRLMNGTFELCSAGTYSRKDVATLISDVTGRPIKPMRIDPNSLGPDAAPMLPMFEHYDHQGLVGSDLTLRAVLGREPRSLRSYFEELASAGKGAIGSNILGDRQ